MIKWPKEQQALPSDFTPLHLGSSLQSGGRQGPTKCPPHHFQLPLGSGFHHLGRSLAPVLGELRASVRPQLTGEQAQRHCLPCPRPHTRPGCSNPTLHALMTLAYKLGTLEHWGPQGCPRGRDVGPNREGGKLPLFRCLWKKRLHWGRWFKNHRLTWCHVLPFELQTDTLRSGQATHLSAPRVRSTALPAIRVSSCNSCATEHKSLEAWILSPTCMIMTQPHLCLPIDSSGGKQ